MICRICQKGIGTAVNGMCNDCSYLYEVMMKTNSSTLKRETLERMLGILKADYGAWKGKDGKNH